MSTGRGGLLRAARLALRAAGLPYVRRFPGARSNSTCGTAVLSGRGRAPSEFPTAGQAGRATCRVEALKAALLACLICGCGAPPADVTEEEPAGHAADPRRGRPDGRFPDSAAGEAAAPPAPAPPPEVSPEVAALLRDLCGPDRQKIERAKDRLAGIGAPVLPALIYLLKQAPPTDRARVTMVLVRIGPEAVPPLVGMFSEGDTSHMASACVALAQFGRDAVPALVEALKTGNDNTRYMAAETLGDIGPEAADAAAALAQAAGDPCALVRTSASGALAKILSPSAEPDLPRIPRPPLRPKVDASPERIADLIRDLKNADQPTWTAACKGLEEIGAPAVPALVDLLKAGNARDKAAAGTALIRIGRPAAAALAGVLRDGDDFSRFTAAATLGSIGSDASEAVPALQEAAGDANPVLRAAVQAALRNIRGE